MEPSTHFVQIVVGVFSSFIASSGFWLYLDKRRTKRDDYRTLIVGLAHVRIIELALCYIERGWITHEEYETLNDFLYLPYRKIGANGSASRLMEIVQKLPTVTETVSVLKKGDKNDFKQPSL